MKLLDLRTLPCPQPVIECRKILNEDNISQLQIIVDNDAAVENVSRYLIQQGFSVQKNSQDNDFVLLAHKGDLAMPNSAQVIENTTSKTTLALITTETLGRGDEELGKKLMATFLSTLPELGTNLWRIVLLNGGVKLAANDGPALESLKTLENNGIKILVCGTCLAHYGLEKQVGETSNMLDIVTGLDLAEKIIRP